MTLTVSRRIALGFALGLGLVVLIAGLGVVALRATASGYRRALEEQQSVVQTALKAQSDLLRSIAEYVSFLATRREEDARARDSVIQVARALTEALRDSARTVEDRSVWNEALGALSQWDARSLASIVAARAGRSAEALRIRDEEVIPARTRALAAYSTGASRAQQRGLEVVGLSRSNSRRMQLLLVAGALIVLTVGSLSAVALNRAVNAPLRETTGILASTAAEIVAATTQQGSAASETSAAVAEVVATVDQVTQSAEQAAQRAKAVADTAQRTAELGRAGRSAVEGTVDAMRAVRQQMESVAANIMALAEQAQAIGEIIASVTELAEQSNLLALNAAVEAARAGEQGRGFSVVAGEVRALAEQSKKATAEVRRILGDIQRGTTSAVMVAEQGTKQVADAVRQVAESGEAIRALADAVAESAQAAVQIVASAGQQAAGMAQVRQAMASIREATQQNLASTRQAERAAQDLSTLGGRLLRLVGDGGTSRPPALTV
ncbi:MAG TPA: methyl-accepting chemotaxis protein [Gemmatimonadales bacterium]|nr:methyl-accepting chemotaxis protein [Gemmatimonadales bacterium]